jgi:hypothetical protein
MDLTEFTFTYQPGSDDLVMMVHTPCNSDSTWNRWSAFNLEQVLRAALNHKCPIPSTPPPDKERPQGEVVPIRPDEAFDMSWPFGDPRESGPDEAGS